MLSQQCRAHLKEVDETAFQHMYQALKVAVKLQLLVPAIIIHAFVPRLFTHTGTNVMNNILEKRRGMDKK
tara:strand:- start:2404 stop:2613 length:210 start_codon:yes stop_codon:yes gene_type:complete